MLKTRIVIRARLTKEERAAVDDLKARAALDDAGLVRLALWRLAEHYELDLPLHCFAMAGRRRRVPKC